MFKIFKKHKKSIDPVENKFDSMVNLIKDLPKSDYERLKDAMDLAYNAYQKVRNVKTIEEKAIEKQIKENADIDIAEKILEDK